MVAFGKQNRFEKQANNSGAGFSFNPESLSFTGLNRQQVNPSSSFGKAIRFKPLISPKSAGATPALTSLVRTGTNLGGGFSKEKRFRDNSGQASSSHFMSPPQMGSDRAAGSIGKAKRFNFKDKSDTPGPASYAHLLQPRKQGAHMGSSKRFADRLKALTPGPDYLPERAAPNRGAAFSSAMRFSTPGSDVSRPSSESSYLKPQSALTNSGARFGTSSRFEGGGEGGGGGGGRSGSKSASRAPTRSSTRNSSRESKSRGSEGYNPVSFSNVGYNKPRVNFTGKFGTSKRFQDAPNTTPGPGAPSFHQNGTKPAFQVSGGFSKSTRWANRVANPTPGPANYDPPDVKAKNIATPTMGKAKRFGANDKTGPGPGYMPPGIERTGSAVLWGKPREKDKEKTKEPEAGPGFIAAPQGRFSSTSGANFGSGKRFDSKNAN